MAELAASTRTERTSEHGEIMAILESNTCAAGRWGDTAAADEQGRGALGELRLLKEQWTADADLLRRYGDERGAHVSQMHAAQLESALQQLQWETVSLEVAEEESGYTRGHLRRMLSEGTLPNVGTAQDPKVFRCHLPRKPGHGVAALRRQPAYSLLQVARAVAAGGE